MADPVIVTIKAEAVTIADAIKAQFLAAANLSYFDGRVTTFEDEMTLELAGAHPWVNINIEDVKIKAADNLDIRDYERHIYPVVLFFSNRAVCKADVKRGTKITTDGTPSGDPGLFDIYDDIQTAIKADPTFGGVVKRLPYSSEFASDVKQYQNGEYWVGRAAVMFEVYKDIFVKK